MKRRIAVLLAAFAIVVSACADDDSESDESLDSAAAAEGGDTGTDGGDTAAGGGDDSGGEGEGGETAEGDGATDDAGESAEGGASGAVAGEGADCLVGSWEAPPEVIEDQVRANLAGIPGVDPEVQEGEITAEFRPDGTADFATAATVSGNDPNLGPIEGMIDGVLAVDWSVEGDELTYVTRDWTAEITIGGIEVPDLPGPLPGEETTVVFTCTADELLLESDDAARVPARLQRVG